MKTAGGWPGPPGPQLGSASGDWPPAVPARRCAVLPDRAARGHSPRHSTHPLPPFQFQAAPTLSAVHSMIFIPDPEPPPQRGSERRPHLT